MATLDNELQKAISTIPECLAAGYVDISTGMMLAVKTVDSHPSEVMDLLAAATSDLFQGPNVIAIEDVFKKARGIKDSDLHYFQEMLVMSDNLLHIFIRGKNYGDHIVTFVCRKSVNMGMALTKARMVMPNLEAAL
ncbi:MAG: hypothetical protein L3J24_09705 [Xanthomonadales bacterium]|nr:hypothetical protein [Xanthomonadales bacterium]